MMSGKIQYDKPREKLQKKGISALQDTELLQLLIGSGTAQANVAKVAKRTLKVLQTSGSDSSYEQFAKIGGLGPARISQLLAAFELASRYPVNHRRLLLDSKDKIEEFIANDALISDQITYITIDGAQRLIAKRTISFEKNTITMLLRGIFTDAIDDDANGIIICRACSNGVTTPSLSDLMLARDLRRTAQLLGIGMADYLMRHGTKFLSIMKEL